MLFTLLSKVKSESTLLRLFSFYLDLIMKVKTVMAINIATGLSVCCVPIISCAAERENIGKITVQDKTKTIKQRDRKGADDQYDKDESNIYISKEAVERYKGTNPADVLTQGVGVYSGDARNSGALDPNIRGIQGQGRVPVTVDGTEQAITVWRGYNGANNRNYVDPNMISSITVIKSPMLDRNIRTSTGGGVAVKTITIDDVVEPEDKFGVDIKLETSSNSTKPKINHLNHGVDYRDDAELMESFHNKPNATRIYFQDEQVLVEPNSRGNTHLFNLKDNAARFAIGTRQDVFDFMMAYSYRNQGNYFAGKRGADQFRGEIVTYDYSTPNKGMDPYMPFVANIYAPNKEVANTSNEMKSLLSKLNIKLTDTQKLSLGYIHTQSQYGEIMPSQIRYHDLVGKIPQWPLANLTLETLYANYAFKPESNPLIDLQLGYWLTKTDLNSNTAGGQPREPMQRDWGFDYNKDNPRNPKVNSRLVDGIKLNQLDERQGISVSNKFKLNSDFDVTIMGNFTKETIGSRDDIFNSDSTPISGLFRAMPREGERHEYNGAIKLDWRPTEWLSLNAGMQYINYWSRDKLHERRIEAKDANFAPYSRRYARNYRISRTLTTDEAQEVMQYIDEVGLSFNEYKPSGHYKSEQLKKSKYKERHVFVQEALSLPKNAILEASYRRHNSNSQEFRIVENKFIQWKLDDNNRLMRDQNPFYNGEVDLDAEVIDPITGLLSKQSYALMATNHGWDEIKYTNEEKFKKPERKEDSAWAPSFGASVYLTDNDRVFARYLETVRMPSIFENTVGFSGSGNINYVPPKFAPERSHTIEIGYVRNLQELLDAENHADIRLNYYNTVITNAFERDMDLVFTQVDKHKTAGLELLARYDNGRIFGDVGVDYRLKNEVCDEASLMRLDPYNKYDTPECVEAGFPGGYLRTQLQPKYSVHANIGVRFFEESLEIGSRMRYHSKAENKDEAAMMGKYPYQYAPLNNTPMNWNSIFIADAYASYQVNKDMLIELLATNLLDEYYLDPLTRSMMPAPGRSIRFSVTSRF